jgi:maleate isomerase
MGTMPATGRRAARVGVLTPHMSAGPEVEIPEMAPAGIDVVVERTRPEALQPAVARLCEASVDVIAYASTTTGYTLGRAAELELVERLRQLSKVPVVTTGIATTQALAAFGVRRVAVVHPPWFDDDLGDLAAAYFRGQGLDVAVSTATSIPRDPERVRPEHVIDWANGSTVDASTDAIFLAGNGFRAAQAIETLERRTGQLVVEANQVLLHSILAATRTPLQLDGYGRLLRSSRS